MRCVDLRDTGHKEMVGFQLPTRVDQNALDRMKTFFKTIALIHKMERFSR